MMLRNKSRQVRVDWLIIRLIDKWINKSINQISWLHVYHHATMVLLADCGYRIFPWPSMALPILLNSFVHIWVYGYYLLSAIDKSYCSMRLKRSVTEVGGFGSVPKFVAWFRFNWRNSSSACISRSSAISVRRTAFMPFSTIWAWLFCSAISIILHISGRERRKPPKTSRKCFRNHQKIFRVRISFLQHSDLSLNIGCINRE